MSYRLKEYPDRDMMMMDVANTMAGALNEAVMVNGSASLAVPGGSTPGPIFDVLCAADIDWSKVTILPSDERWVPEGSEHSNARLIRERLLVERAAAAQFMPLYREGADGPQSVAAMSEELTPFLPLSVAVLGMGGDMHTASLFPGEAALRPDARHDENQHVHFVKTPGLAPKVSRMTLTVPVLNGAMSKHIVITGADKKAALAEAAHLNDPYQAPICAVLSGATVHWAE